MKQLEQVYEIKAPMQRVWQALVDPHIIEAWGGGPATMSDKPGDIFSLWGGDIFGKNITVEAPKLLIQEWSDSNFTEPSKVRFELSGSDDGTTLRLIQSNIADDRLDDIADGWRDFYLGPLKTFLES